MFAIFQPPTSGGGAGVTKVLFSTPGTTPYAIPANATSIKVWLNGGSAGGDGGDGGGGVDFGDGNVHPGENGGQATDGGASWFVSSGTGQATGGQRNNVDGTPTSFSTALPGDAGATPSVGGTGGNGGSSPVGGAEGGPGADGGDGGKRYILLTAGVGFTAGATVNVRVGAKGNKGAGGAGYNGTSEDGGPGAAGADGQDGFVYLEVTTA